MKRHTTTAIWLHSQQYQHEVQTEHTECNATVQVHSCLTRTTPTAAGNINPAMLGQGQPTLPSMGYHICTQPYHTTISCNGSPCWREAPIHCAKEAGQMYSKGLKPYIMMRSSACAAHATSFAEIAQAGCPLAPSLASPSTTAPAAAWGAQNAPYRT